MDSSFTDWDRDIREFVERVIEAYRDLLGNDLIGIYLHGSLAMGCYHRAKSDIDLLIVVDSRLGENKRRSLANLAVKLSDARPTTGDLELSIVRKAHTLNFSNPLPFEVHYSSDWKARLKNDEVDFNEDKSDPDLAAHCTVIQNRGICLYGAPIPDVFGPVSWESFREAVLDDFSWIIEDEHILESPFYSILNCCRTIQLLKKGNGTVASKEEGGIWGLSHLPPKYHSVIQQALDCYRSLAEVSENQRKNGGLDWNAESLRQFRDYCATEVKRLMNTG